MGVILRWLLMLSCLYISVEAHAYGYRPQPQPVRPAAYSVKRPSPYSYVWPAARGVSPQQPAVKYAPSATIPAAKYAAPSAVPPSTIPPVTISPAAYKSGDFATEALLYTTPLSTYNADTVYYTTEPTYYTTTPYSYYAEPIYYSTQQPHNYGATESSTSYSATDYSYIDPGTYFGEDVTGYYTDAPSALYTSPANNAPVATPVDYVTAAPADYAPVVPADYVAAAQAHYYDFVTTEAATPAYYPYTDPTAYYSVASGAEQYAPAAIYYTDSTPVYDGQQSYIVGNDGSYVTDVPVFNNNDFTTAVPVYYYPNEQAPATATISPFYPAEIQYTA